MRARQVVVAALVGLAVFGAVEIASARLGVLSAMTAHAWLDALAYAVGAVVTALILAPLFRSRSGIAGFFAVVFFLILFPLVTGVAGGVIDLFQTGSWANSSLVRGAFTVKPVNTLYTFAIDLWFVAVPVTLVGAVLLVMTGRRR